MLYFVPHVQTVTAEKVKELGLGYADVKIGGRGVSNGPGGKHGVMTTNDPSGSCGYYPDSQVWGAAPQGDAESPPYWVGYDKDAIPGPDDLKRKEQVEGDVIKFRNGTKWMVPKLHSWHLSGSEDRVMEYRVELPCLISLDKYGHVIQGSVVKEYADLFDLGMRVQAKLANGKEDLTNQQMWDFAIKLLSINYKVSMLEMCELVTGHMAIEDATQVIHAGIDWDRYVELVGKALGRLMRPDTGSNSGVEPPNEGENSEDTNQPLES